VRVFGSIGAWIGLFTNLMILLMFGRSRQELTEIFKLPEDFICSGFCDE
jgi:hypothetical protein